MFTLLHIPSIHYLMVCMASVSVVEDIVESIARRHEVDGHGQCSFNAKPSEAEEKRTEWKGRMRKDIECNVRR